MTMTVDCEQLLGYVAGFSLVKTCDRVKNGALRIALPMTYPNGSHIDLFLEAKGNLFDSFVLSDYGLTYDYLMELNFNPYATKKRRRLVDDVCRLQKVVQNAGVFQIEISQDELKDLPGAMVRLSLACVRIADLSFTQRAQAYGAFETEVEEFIALTDLQYEDDVDLYGKFGKIVRVDFKVKGRTTNSLVQTLSTRNPTTAHRAFIDAFVKWHDLELHQNNYQFITVYDSLGSTLRDEDLARMMEVSTVFSFPQEQGEMAEALAS